MNTKQVSVAKLALSQITTFCLAGLLYFGAAGTLYWTAGWLCLLGQLATSICLVVWLRAHDPALLEERMTYMKKTGERWDKLLTSIMMLTSMLCMVIAGFDAVRFRWSHVPFSVQLLGFVGTAFGTFLMVRTMQENTFLTPVVELQRDRRHKVISTGPYAYVRHPLYAADFVMLVALPLFLGSLWALIPSVLVSALLVYRIILEESTLRRGLAGYVEYTQRVRYRIDLQLGPRVQFTAEAFTRVLLERGVRISMDGKGRCLDNVFVERLWRSLKYEQVYLHVYDDLSEARASISAYFEFYNHQRRHQALDYKRRRLRRSRSLSSETPSVVRTMGSTSVKSGPIDPGIDRIHAIPLDQACGAFPNTRVLAINVTGEESFLSSTMRCPTSVIRITLPANADAAFTEAGAMNAVVTAGRQAVNKWFRSEEGRAFLATAMRVPEDDDRAQ